MLTQSARESPSRLRRKVVGGLLVLLGLLALVTPLTPGSWLIFVGLGLLGVRIGFWEDLRSWSRERIVKPLIHKQAIAAMENEIGKVVHYYDKLGVAIVELSAPLAVGDRVKISRGEDSFEQDVTSMQIEHAPATKAKKGESVGIKVDQRTKEGAVVTKVTA